MPRDLNRFRKIYPTRRAAPVYEPASATTVTADLEQLDFTLVSTQFSADGVETNPDSTSLIRPDGSSASLAASGNGVYTFTPDEPGVYVVQGTYGTTVIARTVRIGMEYKPGIWAEQIWDLDLPTIGTASPEDYSGGGVFTIDGVSFTMTIVSGTPTTFALNSTGVKLADDAGSGLVACAIAHDHSSELAGGDIAIYVAEVGCQASGDDQDRTLMRQTSASSGAGTPSHNLWIDRNTSSDWQWGIERGAGIPNDGQISTSAPASLRKVQIYDGQTCYHHTDNEGGTVTKPSDVTFRGTTFTRIITENNYVGSRPNPWSTSNWIQFVPVAQDSDASWYYTRIALYKVRGGA